MQQRVVSWNLAYGYCGKDTAFVHGMPTLPTELLSTPLYISFNSLLSYVLLLTVCFFVDLFYVLLLVLVACMFFLTGPSAQWLLVTV